MFQRLVRRVRLASDADFYSRMTPVAYIALIAGYGLSLATSARLSLGPVLLFSGINLAWGVVLYYLQREDSPPGMAIYQIVALAVLAIAALLCLPLGIGFDWLLPTVTTSVAALACRWRTTAIVVTAFILAMTAAILLAHGGWSDVVKSLLQMAPAYLFVVIFAIVLRRQEELRQQAEALAAEITRANRELAQAHEELRARASEAEELTVSRERNRMAREIHDTLGHYLTILAVQLETALKLDERHDRQLNTTLHDARRVAAECLAEVRRSVAALRPGDIALLSLPDALRRLVDEHEKLLPEVAITLDVEGAEVEAPADLRAALYRCAQEALTNIRKHAQASKVLVRLRVDPLGTEREDDERWVELTILDNGRGPDRAGEASRLSSGFGLTGMGERIALLGGTAHAAAEPGTGWRVEVRAPLDVALQRSDGREGAASIAPAGSASPSAGARSRDMEG